MLVAVNNRKVVEGVGERRGVEAGVRSVSISRLCASNSAHHASTLHPRNVCKIDMDNITCLLYACSFYACSPQAL